MGFGELLVTTALERPLAGASSRTTTSSTKVFHSPQDGQRPIHWADCAPQLLQKYKVLFFATILYFCVILIWYRYGVEFYAFIKAISASDNPVTDAINVMSKPFDSIVCATFITPFSSPLFTPSSSPRLRPVSSPLSYPFSIE